MDSLTSSYVAESRGNYKPINPIVKDSFDVYKLLSGYAKRDKEHFLCVTLSGSSEVIKRHLISVGTLNQSLVHPREVFRAAIKDNAAGIIIAHNHPSGAITASDEDLRVTQRLKEAGQLLGIELLDHIILGKYGCFSSLRDKGIL